MPLEEIGYQKLSSEQAVVMLQRVRNAYPGHTYNETDVLGVYWDRLSFYRRYLCYYVERLGGAWYFYASEQDVILDDPNSVVQPEDLVNARDPIYLDEQTVLDYIHYRCLGKTGYIWDASIFKFPADTPRIHREMVRNYVRPPRLGHIDTQGNFFVLTTFNQEEDADEKPCNDLLERTWKVLPTGEILPGDTRVLVHNLRGSILWRR